MASNQNNRLFFALAICVTLGLSFFFTGKSLGSAMIGSAPTASLTTKAKAKAKASPLPKSLQPLKEAVDKDPDSIPLRMEYLSVLQEHLRIPAHVSERTRQEFATLIASTAELAKDSPETLRELAMRSFEVKYFGGARDLYKQYLALKPDDVSVRSQYASTLSFLGEQQQAIQELEGILKQNPEHFQTLAFLSIVKASVGEREEAIQIGKKAIQLAPHQEAKDRLSAFLLKLEAPDLTSTEATTENSLVQYLQSHEILSRKFVRLEEQKDSQTLDIYVHDFPMDKMPPFAKVAFLTALKREVQKAYSWVSQVQIVDEASKTILHNEPLTEADPTTAETGDHAQ